MRKKWADANRSSAHTIKQSVVFPSSGSSIISQNVWLLCLTGKLNRCSSNDPPPRVLGPTSPCTWRSSSRSTFAGFSYWWFSLGGSAQRCWGMEPRKNLQDFHGGERQESGRMRLAIRSDYSSFRVVLFRGPDSADTRRSGPSLFYKAVVLLHFSCIRRRDSRPICA